MGLRQINNCVFIRASQDNLTKIHQVKEYMTFGYPTKKLVNDLIRKRGFLKKDTQKLAISDNLLIEELLGEEVNGPTGCICIEDVIDTVYRCKDESVFDSIQKVMWPMQLGSLKETIEEANLTHEATGREIRKKNTVTEKGGYIGFQGARINEFVSALI